MLLNEVYVLEVMLPLRVQVGNRFHKKSVTYVSVADKC